jgi:hypothetical protein
MTAVAQAEPLAQRITVDGEYQVSNDALKHPEELRRRLSTSGYLFLKDVLNKTALLQLRREILELCLSHGWLKPGSELMDGVFRGGEFPRHNFEYMELYRKLQKLDSFNDFSRSVEIMKLFETILDSEILAHPRNIARISFPRHYNNTTQPHQDYHYIRGTPETFTAWIPVGACPKEMGGLALLEGSHALGYMKHEPAIGAGGNGLRTEKLGLRWLTADYELGDFVLFHSYTVHGALDNHTPDRLRMSLDYRYQRAKDEVDPSSLQPHGG